MEVYAGLSESEAAPVLAERIASQKNRKTIVITAGAGGAETFAKDLSFYLSELSHPSPIILSLFDEDPPSLRAESKSKDADAAKFAALAALAGDESCVVCCPVSAALAPVSPKENFRASEILLEEGSDALDIDELKRRLSEAGYTRMDYTESPGEFSVRGGVVDVFPIQAELPCRIDFFDSEIERIMLFDPETQKTEGRKSSLKIAAAGFGETGSVPLISWADTPGDISLVAIDPLRIERALELHDEETKKDFLSLFEKENVKSAEWEVLGARTFAPLHGQLDLLASEIKKYLRKGFALTLVCASEERAENLRKFTDEQGFAGKISFAEGGLSASIELPQQKKVWLRDGDIFKSEKKKRRTRLHSGEKIAAFTDISAGDYVVHERHGVGIFKGIRSIETDGNKKDYLAIAYAGKDLLYIPIDQMALVQRYIGSGEKKPRISKLGTGEWERTKAKAKQEVYEYAKELIRMAAERKLAKGHQFAPDTVWQKDFDDRFPWEPTPDQKRCFDVVRKDMEQSYPMDRLICGDVGYGKTEVALRAAFKCASEGKQVCVLVPTTLLASQHYRTFTDRFSDFPISVECLSRFQSHKKQQEIFAKIKSGDADIVIGTHMLLSKKTQFKDLGLLVIDEEQRFGVRHKEKIRSLRAGVDVLTLSATPIPRTLHMSLIGLRDMELIEDPPEDRHPIRTYVSEEREETIAESIRRELDRDGQVYVVYNRVGGIERIAEKIASLVPEARVAVCHGQMNEASVEEIALNFAEGDYDVLVSTTIVESGLDIPNVNTMLVLDADRLGLTQLYQLRGRVGRSERIAFCHLFYRKDKILTEAARKRLRTLKEFTELGSGFKIAMKDLEIRGAGNLLGVRQHGHIASVGYELYCKLLDEAALQIKSGCKLEEESIEECRIESRFSAVIPSTYIEDESVKLEAYKKIALISSEDVLNETLIELEDRFGQPPIATLNLCRTALIKHKADTLQLPELVIEQNRAILTWKTPPEDLAHRVFVAAGYAEKQGAKLETNVSVPSPRLTYNYSSKAVDDAAKLAELAKLCDALMV